MEDPEEAPRSTRLGEGMTDKAFIGRDLWERTLKAIEEFTAAARLAGASELAYGTSIMRDAANGGEFSDEVTAAAGIPVMDPFGKGRGLLQLYRRSRYVRGCGDVGSGYRRRFYGNLHGFRHGYRHASQLQVNRLCTLFQAVRYHHAPGTGGAEEALL